MGVAFFWHYVHFDLAYLSNHHDAFPFYRSFHWFYDYGYNLVDFFFVLSGFVFMHTYAQKIVNGQISFKEYAINRLSRLYPLHILTLFIVAGQVIWMQSRGHSFIYQNNDFFHFVLSALMIQSGWFGTMQVFNGPSWSIATELIVYILFFVTISKLKSRFRYNIAFLSFIYIGIAMLYRDKEFLILNSFTLRALLGFFVGTIACQFAPFIKSSSRASTTFQSTFLGGAIVLIVLSHKFGFREFFGRFEIVFPMIVYPSIILFVIKNKLANYILSLSPFQILGNCSFSIYLWHYPVQTVLHSIYLKNGISAENPVAWFIFVPCVFAVAIPSYYFFEKPIQNKIREKFLSRDSVENRKVETIQVSEVG